MWGIDTEKLWEENQQKVLAEPPEKIELWQWISVALIVISFVGYVFT